MVKTTCGAWVACKCLHCHALHSYQRFCKTAGCDVPGCAQARMRLHLRKMCCVDFDFSKPFVFITLTLKNCSLDNVDSKQYRKERIHQVLEFCSYFNMTKFIIAHQITVPRMQLPVSSDSTMHYHHHIIAQMNMTSDLDYHSQMTDQWERITDQNVNFAHGVDVQQISSENHQLLFRYLCRYLSKDKDRNYYPKGMKSFERHGTVVSREFDYDMITNALCYASEVEDWKTVIRLPSKYHDDQSLSRTQCSEFSKKGFQIQGALDPSYKRVFVGRNERVVIQDSVTLKICVNVTKQPYTIGKNGSFYGTKVLPGYNIIKQCVNCKKTFREDKYCMDTLYVLYSSEPSECQEYLKSWQKRPCYEKWNKDMIKSMKWNPVPYGTVVS